MGFNKELSILLCPVNKPNNRRRGFRSGESGLGSCVNNFWRGLRTTAGLFTTGRTVAGYWSAVGGFFTGLFPLAGAAG